MQGLPIGLLAATGLSALLAFGVIQSSFTQQAQALFYVFGAIALAIIAGKKFLGGGGGGGHGKGHGGGHGDGGVVFSGRAAGTLTIVAAIMGLLYFWTDNEMNAQKLGYEIDRGVQAAGDAVTTLMRDDDDRN